MTNEPAFPQGPELIGGNVGMTLRDYFAAKAMQSLIRTGEYRDNRTRLATDAYFYADAMLAERLRP